MWYDSGSTVHNQKRSGLSLPVFSPSFRQQSVQGNRELRSSSFFETLIEKLLSTLDHDPNEELLVILVDALKSVVVSDTILWCENTVTLLCGLQRWAQEDHLSDHH